MSPLLALWLTAVVPQEAEVRALSVTPGEMGTDVVVAFDGNLAGFHHFRLGDPDRIVLDLQGARHALPRERYTDLDRGGINMIRTSQFERDVVRIVLELSEPTVYRVAQEGGAIRITLPENGDRFEPWHTEEDRTPPPAPVPEPRVAPVPQPAERPQPQEPRISIFFQEAPIREVLAHFAEFSGRSIVHGPNVTGTVNADIRNQPWDVALQEILHAHSLRIEEREHGILRVTDLRSLRELAEVEELETRTFAIRYISVDSIRPAVEGLLAQVQEVGTERSRSQEARVSTNRSTNTLLITAGRTVLDRITPLIEQLDVRSPQVTISSQIIFIDRTALDEFGIVYDLKDSQGNRINTLIRPEGDPADADVIVTLGGSSIAGLANANLRVQAPALQLVGSLVLGRHSLVGFIEALQQMTLTDIQARPVVSTMSHREARVQVGERTPVRILDPGTTTGPGQIGARAAVEMVETGVILRVTPHVTGNQILLEMHAERSNVALAPADIGFTFQTQEAQTQVLLNDGETAVIGGLTVTEKNQVRTGIPYLMNLPLVGALFRTSTEREVKQDLLILVTPHIIREDGS